MKKNILYRLYAAAFIGICLVPSALMPIAESNSSKEKRELAEFPKATKDGKLNFSYFSEFESWFSDHMAFRQQLVTADGRLKASLLGTSPNKNVIVGKDGWLYYSETVNDFLRLDTLSDRAVNNISRDLELINDYCRTNGSQFIFTVAPNKNSVYPDYMPFNYLPTRSRSNYDRLSEALENDEFWCNMRSALLSAESSIPLYHKTDTHWNNMGAYVGHVKLMEMLGHEVCPTGDSWTTRNDRQGDLAAMIYPAEDPDDMQVYCAHQFSYNYLGKFQALDDISIRTSCDTGTGDLLMFRDSYGEAIIPFMAEVFKQTEFSRMMPYRIEGSAGKTVIIEIVERNIPNLLKYTPVMKAPTVDISELSPEIYSGSGVQIVCKPAGGFTQICGELPEEFFSGSSNRIFVTAGGTAYEAFHSFEAEALGREGGISDRGFSLYIPSAGEISPDDVTVTVLSADGRAVANK